MTNDVLRDHYDAMWDTALPAIASGAVDCDLGIGAVPDQRRGLTLIARPALALQASFDALLATLATEATGQYRYPASDMHVTILPLFTATEHAEGELARMDDYRAVAQAAVARMAPFEIDFDGLTLSNGAVMARGVPRDQTLETLRERLRAGLRARGLDATVDQRYRLVTAHVTLLRFAAPLRAPARFAALLAALRNVPLGTMRVEAIELVVNDWYMSSGALQRVAVLSLRAPGTGLTG